MSGFAPDPARRAMLGKVHIAAKELGLIDDDYRAILLRVAGVASARDCTAQQLRSVLDKFTRLGWKPALAKGRTPTASRRASSPAAKKARALWISLHQLGAVRNASEASLEAFAVRQLKVDRLAWANEAQCYKLIEALKDMAERHGWQQSIEGVGPAMRVTVLKRRLVSALLDKLKAAGIVPADWSEANAAFRLLGEAEQGGFMLWGHGTLERVTKGLAAVLADPRKQIGGDL